MASVGATEDVTPGAIEQERVVRELREKLAESEAARRKLHNQIQDLKVMSYFHHTSITLISSAVLTPINHVIIVFTGKCTCICALSAIFADGWHTSQHEHKHEHKHFFCVWGGICCA